MEIIIGITLLQAFTVFFYTSNCKRHGGAGVTYYALNHVNFNFIRVIILS